jgi:DNA-binding NtrC family response regulator
MAQARILIVDDEKEFSAVVAERLQNRGMEADTTESGQDAIRMVKEKTYDAVVLDLAMPGMDGLETLRQLLAYDKDLQIILLTGHATVEKGVEAMKLGAVDFLEKPADISTLVGKVTQAQEKRFERFQEKLDEKMSDLMKKKGW